ncbi:hypothetical protein ONZ43_g2562 [Nemania bipapillata]|uniref:Uncharacterized protein n=1 Tax=Nemania bipapillata TaxID=110536 RepID=A0ACC2J039_9PEZI|nr:hypothetical protein ONZ43_g2562 [Nemania bipapillata]
MLAQRYPALYDGIAAGAPAIHWNPGVGSVQWPQQVMNMLDKYPYPCELDAIVEAAITSCDGLDGVVDGIIAEVDECLTTFDPFSIVGTLINCTEAAGETIQVSEAAAVVVDATWAGPSTESGNWTWYGLNPGADITGSHSTPATLISVQTNCTGGVCVGVPNPLSSIWLQLFVAKNPEFNVSNITHAEFDSMIHLSQQLYGDTVGTEEPDLTEFHNAGGKLVTFHGLADTLIPPNGSSHYYNSVAAVTPGVDQFYRHFEIPGLGHCYSGRSGQPSDLFLQLRAWVENGTAPERTVVNTTDLNNEIRPRILCPYPKKVDATGFC